MNQFNTIAEKIIEEQESIIGPIALEQARKVPGLKVDWPKREVSIEGDESAVIQKLVEQYQNIFGRASVEACKEAVKNVISQIPVEKIPNLLR
jgi:hypothetical protein